jgi:two-component system NtrC family response regulator
MGLLLRWIHPEPRPDTALRAELDFGRGEDCDVQLEGDSTSRQHARTVSRGGSLLIEDQKSRNGTYCNGERVDLAPLNPGSVLRFGEWLAVVSQRAETRGFGHLAAGLWGSERLAVVVEQARTAATSALPLLITGETGTGKELLCRAIHDVHKQSGRKGTLVSVNSAALADSLVDAELFGHEVGAFTGASGRRLGLVREADGGTFFLDEVAELSPLAQAKLLRVLQESEVLPVGGNRQKSVDLRVVTATHRDLAAMSAQGSFRSDLYARLAGVCIEMPALRQRREDIFPLFAAFASQALGRALRCTPRFVEKLCCYEWPRNVRELKHCAERLALACRADLVWHRRHLSEALPDLLPPSPAESPTPRDRTPAEIVQALKEARGNVTKAARALEMSRDTLYKLMREHGIVPDQLRHP